MRGFQFDIMGSTRSTWDFYRGYQFSTTVTFVLTVVLLWLLSNMSNSAPREAKPLVLALLIAQLCNVLIGWQFFFAGPGVVGSLIAICIALAMVGLYRPERPAPVEARLVNA
jgi:thiol:disulfide interchange protein